MSETPEINDDSSTEKTETGGRSRRLLWWLLANLAVVVIVPIVWVGYHYQQRMSWIEDAERRGGVFSLDDDSENAGPQWLRDLLGDDRMRPFERYDEVSLVEPTDNDLKRVSQCCKISEKFSLGLDQPQWTTRGKQELLRMGHLKNLVIQGDSSLLDDPKLLAGLSHLEYLKLSETSVTHEQLTNLKKLPRLDTLFLYETQLTDDLLVTIVQHTNLTGLLLARNDITDDALASKDLVNRAQQPFSETMVYLYLDEDDLTNKIIPALETFQKLYYLALFNTHITEQEMNELKIAMPECWIQYGPPGLYPQEH